MTKKEQDKIIDLLRLSGIRDGEWAYTNDFKGFYDEPRRDALKKVRINKQGKLEIK